MPDTDIAIAEAEKKLRELMGALGIRLPAGELRVVSPAQAALLDFCARHPFCQISLEVRAGEPHMASKEWEGGVREAFLLAEERR